MGCQEFEAVLGIHCAPVLLGVKPSNLVSFNKKKASAIPELLDSYRLEFLGEAISTRILCSCRCCYLVFVYRPDLLEASLRSAYAQELLIKCGYPPFSSLDEYLDILQSRYESDGEFPHEIGVFLGYPVEDVIGFFEDDGTKCKMIGYWKVYGDIDYARKQFALYDRCREFACRHLQGGSTIMQVISQKNMCLQA